MTEALERLSDGEWVFSLYFRVFFVSTIIAVSFRYLLVFLRVCVCILTSYCIQIIIDLLIMSIISFPLMLFCVSIMSKSLCTV